MYGNSAMVEDLLKRQKDEINKLTSQCELLTNTVDNLQTRLSGVGLTTEELQGIHELIQSQIKFIANLQTGNDTHEIVSAVSSLIDLASLVSKPTD